MLSMAVQPRAHYCRSNLYWPHVPKYNRWVTWYRSNHKNTKMLFLLERDNKFNKLYCNSISDASGRRPSSKNAAANQNLLLPLERLTRARFLNPCIETRNYFLNAIKKVRFLIRKLHWNGNCYIWDSNYRTAMPVPVQSSKAQALTRQPCLDPLSPTELWEFMGTWRSDHEFWKGFRGRNNE